MSSHRDNPKKPPFPLLPLHFKVLLLTLGFGLKSTIISMKLSEIAAKLGARLEPPDADAEIAGIAGIEAAAPGEITFVANPKYTAATQTTQASAIIVDDKFPPLAK